MGLNEEASRACCQSSAVVLMALFVMGCTLVHEPSGQTEDGGRGRDAMPPCDPDATLPGEPGGGCPIWDSPVPTTQLSAGANHICALGTDGRVRCWGDGENGQLGDGTLTGSGTWIEVQELSRVEQISAGGGFTCAVKRDGTVACWGGLGVDPRPGSGDGVASSWTPRAVDGLVDIVEVAGGGTLACARDRQGEVYCWGGALGELARVEGLSGVTQVDAGYTHACALDEVGAVRCWGGNDRGQLGDGSVVDSSSPVRALLDGPAVALATGDSHTCALMHDGT
ncbi:MAG: RCC1 domain-containing protein, partial [Sandaracinaceae bacterium]